MSGKPGRARSRVRTQWMALGAALVVLAGLLVAWGLSNAADRVEVVQLASDVSAGDVFEATDLALASVAYDGAVVGLVPAGSLKSLVGRVAAIDLQAGALVQSGMWRDDSDLAFGEVVSVHFCRPVVIQAVSLGATLYSLRRSTPLRPSRRQRFACSTCNRIPRATSSSRWRFRRRSRSRSRSWPPLTSCCWSVSLH